LLIFAFKSVGKSIRCPLRYVTIASIILGIMQLVKVGGPWLFCIDVLHVILRNLALNRWTLPEKPELFSLSG